MPQLSSQKPYQNILAEAAYCLKAADRLIHQLKTLNKPQADIQKLHQHREKLAQEIKNRDFNELIRSQQELDRLVEALGDQIKTDLLRRL